MENSNIDTTNSVDEITRLFNAVKKLEADISSYKIMLNDASACKSEVSRSALAKVCMAYWNKWFKSVDG